MHSHSANTPEKVSLVRVLATEIADTYERKNQAYGDSFGRSVQKYGLISALTRMSDKFNRAEQLILGTENRVPDEALRDTLLDLAAYALMTIVEIDGKDRKDNSPTLSPSPESDPAPLYHMWGPGKRGIEDDHCAKATPKETMEIDITNATPQRFG